MSAATELPPVVHIPERARRGPSQPSRVGVRSVAHRSRAAGADAVVCRPQAFSGREADRLRGSRRAVAPEGMLFAPVLARAYVSSPLIQPRTSPLPAVVPADGSGWQTPVVVPLAVDEASDLALTRTVSGAARPEARSADATQAKSGALRLTGRGRFTVAILGLAAAAAFVWVGHLSAPAEAQSRPAVTSTSVVVHDGDTLWSIAGQVDPRHDPRAVVSRLKSLNQLGDADLTPGQTLRVR